MNDEWIKTETAIPSKDGKYLVFYRGSKVVREFNTYHNCWDDEDGDDYLCDAVGGGVTHWQILPGDPA